MSNQFEIECDIRRGDRRFSVEGTFSSDEEAVALFRKLLALTNGSPGGETSAAVHRLDSPGAPPEVVTLEKVAVAPDLLAAAAPGQGSAMGATLVLAAEPLPSPAAAEPPPQPAAPVAAGAKDEQKRPPGRPAGAKNKPKPEPKAAPPEPAAEPAAVAAPAPQKKSTVLMIGSTSYGVEISRANDKHIAQCKQLRQFIATRDTEEAAVEDVRLQIAAFVRESAPAEFQPPSKVMSTAPAAPPAAPAAAAAPAPAGPGLPEEIMRQDNPAQVLYGIIKHKTKEWALFQDGVPPAKDVLDFILSVWVTVPALTKFKKNEEKLLEFVDDLLPKVRKELGIKD